MRCPARFITATALAAMSLVPLSVASRADGARDAHRTRDFISSPHLGPAPAFSKPTH